MLICESSPHALKALPVEQLQKFIFHLKTWKAGTHRIREKEVNALKRIRLKGRLIEIVPSSEDKPSLSSIANFLIPLSSYKKPASFEIWFCQNRISFYIFSTDEKALEEIKTQLHAIYQNAAFRSATLNFVPMNAGWYVCSATLNLEYHYFKIRSLDSFKYDPLAHIIEATNVNAVFQVVFKPKKVSRRTLEKYANWLGQTELAEEVLGKLTSVCFQALIRIAVFSKNPFEARKAVETVANSLKVFDGDYAKFKARITSFPIFTSSFSIVKKIAKRKFSFFGRKFLLSAEELASIFHLPINVKDPRINYLTKPQLPLPSLGRAQNGMSIGYLKYAGESEKVSVSLGDLTRHVYVIGASGTGKTSLLINMISQAQEKGYCIHLIDPHGDMAYDLIECMPEKLEQVVFLDPLKVRFSINPFELPPYLSEYERAMLIEKIIGQMVELMKRIFGARYWGPSLNRTFQNVIRLLYLKDDRPTFEDMLNVLLLKTEKLGNLASREDFRELSSELRRVPKERLDAVINKIDPFVKNALLRMLFCNKRSTVDFEKLLQPGKIVVWRLAKAEITEMNMQMIGSAIMTKLWFFCAARAREDRNPVLLVIDEFQNFAFLETLQMMIAEARKFGIGLVLSHQHTRQLTESLLGEALGNTATKIIFRVSGEDALILARNLDIRRERTLASVLTNLPDGSAVVKLRAGFGQEPIAPFEIFTLEPMERKQVNIDKLIKKMQAEHAQPQPAPQPSQPDKRIQAPPQDERFKEFLEIVEGVGDKGVKEISKASGIKPVKVNELIEKAKQLGLVEVEEVRTGEKGRPRVVVKLTKDGREFIGKLLGREGSLLHRKMIEKVSEYFRKLGYGVEVPAQGGREEQPDLVAKGFNEAIAVEVEVKADHLEQIRRNYEKNLWADRVIFIAPTQEVGWRIKNIVGKDVEVYILEVDL